VVSSSSPRGEAIRLRSSWLLFHLALRIQEVMCSNKMKIIGEFTQQLVEENVDLI